MFNFAQVQGRRPNFKSGLNVGIHKKLLILNFKFNNGFFFIQNSKLFLNLTQ